jgi:hypothetical protein
MRAIYVLFRGSHGDREAFPKKTRDQCILSPKSFLRTSRKVVASVNGGGRLYYHFAAVEVTVEAGE